MPDSKEEDIQRVLSTATALVRHLQWLLDNGSLTREEEPLVNDLDAALKKYEGGGYA